MYQLRRALLVGLPVGAAVAAGGWMDRRRPPVWPLWTRAEVRDASNADGGRVLVTYKDGVYDVTAYVASHPGGDMILQASGGPVDAYWAHFTRHLNSLRVDEVLPPLRVGTLRDYSPGDDSSLSADAAYAQEPARTLQLHDIVQQRPLCTSTKSDVLAQSFLTSCEAFYVRNHTPVPRLDVSSGDAHVLHLGERAVSVAQLEAALPARTVVSVLQCTGNRAGEGATAMTRDNQFFWNIGPGMMGNAVWGGVTLRDALRLSGLVGAEDNFRDSHKHVVLRGADGYSTSIPLAALHDDCLLATTMNGQPLPADHGAPVRAVLPGMVGARSVKWITAVTVEDEPCESCWQSHYYRGRDNQHLLEMPMQSVILSTTRQPAGANETLVRLRGVAWAGASGLPVESVELRCGEEALWRRAALLKEGDGTLPKWSWTRWQYDTSDGACVDGPVRVRATDGVQVQPETLPPGTHYLNNQHHVVVRVQ